jgi:uncharacterized protein involved in exopolysaccharide biosynthesis
VLCVSIVCAVVAGIVGWVMPPEYKATTILSPVTNTSGGGGMGAMGALGGAVGGLASLAGLSVGADSKKAEFVAVLQSEALTEKYISENNLLPILFRKQWDAGAGTWKIKDPNKQPTLWKANRFFKSVRTVTTDSKTSLVTLSIEWTDPKLAQTWANGLVRLTNDYLRDQAVREAERNIAYLNDQASKTDTLGVKQAIYTIMQTEINKAMLARGNDEYALKVIDPAFTPERPSSLGTVAWTVIGLLVGFFLSSAVVVAGVRGRG